MGNALPIPQPEIHPDYGVRLVREMLSGNDVSVTVTRDLRTGPSVWERQRRPAVAHQPLTRPATTDVLVIGAGISGALIAEALSDAGLDVLVVDRRGPMRGSTTASTSLLQYDIDTPLTHLSRRLGPEKALRIWRRSRLALEGLRARTRHLGIDADCVNRDSWYLSGNLLPPRALAQEGEARRRAGFEVVYRTPREVEAQAGIRGRSALQSFDNMEADPRLLTAGYLRVAAQRGVRIKAPVEIVDVQPSSRHVRARTSDGLAIVAGAVVFATGYEMPTEVPQRGHNIVSTWVIATAPQPRRLWPGRGFFWEASEPYLYVRATPDGRVICGGEDEPFADAASRDALIPEKTRTLERKLQRLMPHLDCRAHDAWCGAFGASDSGTPSIGAVPGMPRCFAALGYGGNGITFSALAAQMLRTAILGGVDPDRDLFALARR